MVAHGWHDDTGSFIPHPHFLCSCLRVCRHARYCNCTPHPTAGPAAYPLSTCMIEGESKSGRSFLVQPRWTSSGDAQERHPLVLADVCVSVYRQKSSQKTRRGAIKTDKGVAEIYNLPIEFVVLTSPLVLLLPPSPFFSLLSSRWFQWRARVIAIGAAKPDLGGREWTEVLKCEFFVTFVRVVPELHVAGQ